VLVVSLAPPADAAKYAADLGVETLVKAPPAGAEAAAASSDATRVYRPEMPRGWWLRQRHYFLYIVREFTALPLALWLLWLLFEIHRAANGPKAFYASASPAFIAFSVVCLGFALYHSITFLSLAGVIINIKVMGKPVPSRIVVLSQFALWGVASIVIAAVLIGFAR
jgi:fumarate reductase subunit C